MNICATATAAGLALASFGAQAQTAPEKAGMFFGRNLNIAIRAWALPTYEGGKRLGLAPGGSLAVTKPSAFDDYAAPDDAASFALIDKRHFAIGAAASLRENRDNNHELKGMRSIGWSVQGGGYVNVWPSDHVRLHLEALKGITSQYGLLVNTSADYVVQKGRWRLAAGPRFSWADDTWNNRYFGVTRAEAIASPLIDNPYTAKAGAHFAGFEGSAEYKWLRRWRLTVDARYHRLLGNDAASPLVRQLGRADQFSISTGVRFMLPG